MREPVIIPYLILGICRHPSGHFAVEIGLSVLCEINEGTVRWHG